ncbi:glycosyltransferase family 4 protein [uncultured Thalassospira sp.]|uniref:glycosyltransferase family 4 protein n=1 Tax=uncultured Thalassospira sp. TaxID=404382 RepID=UPI00258C55E0|nr:glycosyltransferase family 4 protein [uncultured Thalassospira sp.]
MKVAFPFVGDTVGGSHISASCLIKALVAHGIKAVPLLHRRGVLQSYLEAQEIDYELTELPFMNAGGGGRGLIELGLALPRISSFLRKNEFDLVHANDGRMINSWMPAAKLSGVPGIAHRRTKWSSSRISDCLHGHASQVICISEYVAQSAPQRFKNKLTVINNPVWPSANSFNSNRRKLEAIGGGGIYLVWVGTLQDQKRPLDFVSIAERLHRENSSLKFVMVGRTSELEMEIKQAIHVSALQDNFFVTGFRQDCLDLIAAADILVATATKEGLGRSLMEAMINGVPVVAAADAGHMEIILEGENGILARPGDIGDFCQGIKQVLNNSEGTKKTVMRAKDYAKRHWSVESYVQQVLAIYQKAADDVL